MLGHLFVAHSKEVKTGLIEVAIPRIRRSDVSVHTPWMIGNENFPSVRSSAKPLVLEYYAQW